MSAITTLQAKTVGALVDLINRNGDHEYLRDVVPLYGTMSSTRFDGDDIWTDLKFSIYVADNDGMLVESKWQFDMNAVVVEIANALGVEPGLLLTYSGERKDDSDAADADERWDYTTWWNLIYMTRENFTSLQKTKHFSVIAENGIERIVAPKPVKHKKAAFAFDLDTAKLKFVRAHNNSVEYVTEDGIAVFDNRQHVVGISSGAVTILTDGTLTHGKKIRKDEPGALLERIACLQGFLHEISPWGDIGRDLSQERPCGKYASVLKEFVGSALELMSWGDLLRTQGRMFAWGIELLYGSAFVPAPVILVGGYRPSAAHMKYTKRMILRDINPPTSWDAEKRSLDSRYVVITD